MAAFYIDGTTLSDSTAVYTDAALSICAPDGFYSDGVVVRELRECQLLDEAPCGNCGESLYLSEMQPVCSDFCSGVNYPIVNLKTTTPPRTYANITIGDLIDVGNVDGYYAYSNAQTDTNTGPYKIMYVTQNHIEGLFECNGTSCVSQ